MNDTRNARYSVTALVSDNEKSRFTSMARDLDVSCKILTRRLIRYLLDGKISWADMFTRYKDLAVADAPDSRRKAQMRTTLPPEQYAAFAQLAESWGSTTPTVIRRLILLYVTGKIGRRDIW